MQGQKTGGREKNTPNKRTQNLLELIEVNHKGFNPVLELIEISKSANIDVDLRVSILKDLTPYLYPKRKAIELELENENFDNVMKICFVHTDKNGNPVDEVTGNPIDDFVYKDKTGNIVDEDGNPINS